MNRYITIQHYSGETFAFTENENWRDALANDDWADFIWQWSDSKEQACEQHIAKHNMWYDSINAGEPERRTY